MRWRLMAFASIGVNIALAIGWGITARRTSVAPSLPSTASTLQAGATNRSWPQPRRLSWRDLESPDYTVFIANLKDIGCPEQTIRDIIIADVNSLFSRRLATELVTADQQWWRSEPDESVVAVAQEKMRGLEDERRSLLARLLGPNWESGDLTNLPRPTRPGVVLDGPILGALPAEAKQAIQEISLRSEERLGNYLATLRAQGKDPDTAELAKLRRQTRNELAQVLAPPQLEEYLLRYSQTANNLRADLGQLSFFNATPEEFRAAFRATDTLDQQISELGDGMDINTGQARKALADQRENALRLALGPKRYEEYRLLHDPLYRDAVAAAREAGNPDAARSIYTVNIAAMAEQANILSNTNLTAEQRNIELKQLELDQLKAAAVAAGQELPPEPQPAASSAEQPVRKSYTLRKGDTPAVVAMIYGVPLSAIRAANPGIDLNRLKPGDSVNLPRVSGPPVPPP